VSVELRVPPVGESIIEVQIGAWLKAPGEAVRQDEPVVSLETDKATIDLPAPVTGVLARTLKQPGDTAKVGEVIAYLEEALPAAGLPAPAPPPVRPAAPPPPAAPAGTPRPTSVPEAAPVAPAAPARDAPAARATPAPAAERRDEVVPMTLLRRRVAERLVAAQQAAALLTTFNEIDLSAVVGLRRAHQEAFRERHGVKLGFMAFFVKATVDALRRVPGVNAEIRDRDVVYHHYCDIGVAVGGGKGLVVPVLRDAERLSFAAIETAIADFARRAQAGALRPEELQGGTFTITNGGVYGSLLSTPIVNPPQSGILGLHAIQDRPVARDGQVVIRPMMFVALTYDHRVVDGREAVTFLRHVKESIEDPARLLLDL